MLKKDRPEFHALVARIAAGELSRNQAAELAAQQTEVSPATLLSWLWTSGSTKQLTAVRGSYGANHWNAEKNLDKAKAYEQALEECRSGKCSVRAVAISYADRGVSYQWLLRRYNKRLAEEAAAALATAPKLTIEALERALKTP